MRGPGEVYIFPPCHSEVATDAIGLHELSELQLIDMLSTQEIL